LSIVIYVTKVDNISGKKRNNVYACVVQMWNEMYYGIHISSLDTIT